MVNMFIDMIKNLEEKIVRIMKYGFLSALLICAMSALVLVTYEFNPISLDLYYSGLSLFQSGITVAVAFVVCGIAFDTIQKNLAK